MKREYISTFFLTKKDMKDMVILNNLLGLNLDINVDYRLEINLLPINYSLGFGYCESELVRCLICLQHSNFYYDGEIEVLYRALASTMDISVKQGSGYFLYGEDIVCHSIFIVTLVRISR